MHKISLKDWVILLTLVPTTLIGLGVATYFSYSRYVELDNFLETQSRSIIEPLAIAGSDLLIDGEREKLRHLISFAHRSQSSIIKSIAVFTQDNQIFVTSSYHGDVNLMRLKASQPIPETTLMKEYEDYLVYKTPIIDETNATSNHASPIGYVALQIDKSKIQFAQQSEVLIAYGIVGLGVLINFIFSMRLIKNVTRPISSMVQAVDRIREGKLNSRISGDLIGELEFLKNGVNSMAQSLEDVDDEMHKSVEQATIDLRESLEQFEIQNVELNIANKKAQDANQVKSEFLANMSHELRTPLNGVIGFTRQVLKTPLSDTQRDYLHTIERSAANLLSIINDILDFSKLDAGKMVIENIPFSIREATEEVLTLLAPSAHQKNIELSFNMNQSVPDSLIGDAMRIKQIIINLASNAIKFTDKGSVNIDIKCQQVDKQFTILRVEMADTGVGINHEQQKAIFEAFGQADKSVTRLYGGTGLGLVISQRLATEMNGDIGFTSEEGKGSTFWFTFKCEMTPIPLISQLPSSALEHKNVLYIEPHMHSRMATTQIMSDWGMQVSHATSVNQLDHVLSQDKQFDHLLIGHDTTPLALDELKKLIQRLSPLVDSIIVAVNSNSPQLQETLVSSGASHCVSKPITPSRLSKAFRHNDKDKEENQVAVPDKKVAPIKVLAVDDNEANLKLIKTLLLEQVAEVVTATNGLEALNLCKIEKYALIFMDIQMPVLDGISAMNSIRAQTFNDSTPIIAVTAHALTGEKDKLIEQGFDFYMSKPIDEAMLSHTIYEYCDIDSFQHAKSVPDNLNSSETSQTTTNKHANAIVDWSLALRRAGNKTDLAKDMLTGLTNSLPETKKLISEALTAQDIEQLKTLVHKLNGACCYSGVPNLGKVTHEIETALKKGNSIEDLEPEFYEFFEHVDNVIKVAPQILHSLEPPRIRH